MKIYVVVDSMTQTYWGCYKNKETAESRKVELQFRNSRDYTVIITEV